MKAMGNRVSVHMVKTVELIAEHDDAEDVPDPAPDSVEDTEITLTGEDKQLPDAAPAAQQSAPEPVKVDKPVKPVEAEKPTESVKSKESEPSVEPTPPAVQTKKVDFEITNPDDIEIDDIRPAGLILICEIENVEEDINLLRAVFEAAFISQRPNR
jgi:topoisomerase-4 subunit A